MHITQYSAVAIANLSVRLSAGLSVSVMEIGSNVTITGLFFLDLLLVVTFAVRFFLPWQTGSKCLQNK